ncbi:hypothetical protein D9M69_521930 [compost metagenome]
MSRHPAGPQRQHHRTMHQVRRLPEERHQRTHHQRVAQACEEVTGGRAVDLAELAGQQLVEAEKQRRAERQQHRRGKQIAPGVNDDQHSAKTENHCQPLPPGHPLAKQRYRQRGDQYRCEEVDRRGLGQRDVHQPRGEKQTGAQQAKRPDHLQQWPFGTQHPQPGLRQENPGHQQGVNHVARPDHHDNGIKTGEVFGKGVVGGKQEGRDNDQQDPFEGLIDAGKRGADGHWVSFITSLFCRSELARDEPEGAMFFQAAFIIVDDHREQARSYQR